MAKKSLQARVTIPKDIRELNGFDNYEGNKLVFFITEDSRVAFCHMEQAQNLNYEILAISHFDAKYRFFIPKNVAAYLGNLGSSFEEYYFTTYLNHSLIYLYKVDPDVALQMQRIQLKKLIATLPNVV